MPSGLRKRTVSVAANATSANVLAGEVIEFPNADSRVRVAATVPAGSGNNITMRVNFGSDVPADGVAVGIEDAAGKGPKIPDDVLFEDTCLASDRLGLFFTNITGVAIITTWLVEVQPLPR